MILVLRGGHVRRRDDAQLSSSGSPRNSLDWSVTARALLTLKRLEACRSTSAGAPGAVFQTGPMPTLQRRNIVGAPPTPDATPTPVAKKNLAADLASSQGSETTMAVARPTSAHAQSRGRPSRRRRRWASPRRPRSRRKYSSKGNSLPVKSIAKVSPRKKAPPPPEQDTSPLSEITADRGSPRVSLEAEEIKEAPGHVDAALLPSPRKVRAARR